MVKKFEDWEGVAVLAVREESVPHYMAWAFFYVSVETFKI